MKDVFWAWGVSKMMQWQISAFLSSSLSGADVTENGNQQRDIGGGRGGIWRLGLPEGGNREVSASMQRKQLRLYRIHMMRIVDQLSSHRNVSLRQGLAAFASAVQTKAVHLRSELFVLSNC